MTRMLVGIVNYGRKNDQYMRTVIDGYRSMPWATDIVVLTSESKTVPTGVELRIEHVPDNPKMFPLCLRRLLQERRNDYDLFAGTEDDVLLLPCNARAFLECSEVMGKCDVPGFLRYEFDADATFVHDLHAHFWWNLTTTQCFGPWAMAQPTNLHSAAYLLTSQHLEVAAASGQLVTPSRPTRDYGPQEASTAHLYTDCGLRKWVPVDRLDDFLLSHLPNTYAGRLGAPMHDVRAHAEALADVARRKLSNASLVATDDLRLPKIYSIQHFGKPHHAIMERIPDGAKRILWIGSTSGDCEQELHRVGREVCCVPHDEVHGRALRQHGLTVRAASLEIHADERFDAIVLSEVASRSNSPAQLFRSLRTLLSPSGVLIVDEWDMSHNAALPRKMLPRELSRESVHNSIPYPGLHFTDARTVASWLRDAGMKAAIESTEPNVSRIRSVVRRLASRSRMHRIIGIGT